jgi:hypothetical protein
MHEVAFGAFTLLVALILGLEGGDTLARKRPGARTLVSACPCQLQIPELEARLAEMAERLDSQDEAWAAWHASHGCEFGRPRLSSVDGTGA